MRTRVSSILRSSAVALVVLASGCSPPGEGTGTANLPPSDVVAILVIDDFDAPASEKTFDAHPEEDCVVTSMGAQVAGGHGAIEGDAPMNTSHGHLVFTEIQQELKNAGLARVAQGDTWWHSRGDYGAGQSWSREVDIWRAGTDGEPDILLVGVDTDQYLARDISSHIETLTNMMTMPAAPAPTPTSSPERVVRFVLNMSFQVVPCEFLKGSVEVGREALRLAHYLEITSQVSGLNELQADLNGFVGATEAELKEKLGPFGQKITDYISKPDNDVASSLTNSARAKKDPLLQFLGRANAEGNKRVIPVAAAGNGLGSTHERLPFPFAPAIWDSIVSVSAESPLSPGTSKLTADYSNDGEITQSGELKYLDPATGPWTLIGTSFAAPRLAVKEAFYLLNGEPVTCVGKPDSIPPLGYNGPPGTPYTWLNLTPQHAEGYCAQFGNHARPPSPAP